MEVIVTERGQGKTNIAEWATMNSKQRRRSILKEVEGVVAYLKVISSGIVVPSDI
jgi:hypothetical protein